jgi:hypothetical protein
VTESDPRQFSRTRGALAVVGIGAAGYSTDGVNASAPAKLFWTVTSDTAPPTTPTPDDSAPTATPTPDGSTPTPTPDGSTPTASPTASPTPTASS